MVVRKKENSDQKKKRENTGGEEICRRKKKEREKEKVSFTVGGCRGLEYWQWIVFFRDEKPKRVGMKKKKKGNREREHAGFERVMRGVAGDETSSRE